MSTKRTIIFMLIMIIVIATALGCGRRRTKPNSGNSGGEKTWSPEDIRKVTKHMVDSIITARFINGMKYKRLKPYWMLVTELKNKTDEHIDTRLLITKIRTQLIRNRKARFIDDEALDDALRQQKMQQSALFNDKTAVKIGELVGARFILRGSLSSIRQRSGGVWYNITMQVVDLQTTRIVWTDDVDITKN